MRRKHAAGEGAGCCGINKRVLASLIPSPLLVSKHHMKTAQRELPEHLTENVSSKCFVFRHPNLFRRKSVVFSYARGQDKPAVKRKAVAYAVKMNEALGPVPPLSPEGRMTSRNRSGQVGVHPKRDIAKRNGLPYYFWVARWKGCPMRGGVSWPCLTHTDAGAYVLAFLTLEMRTVNRQQVVEEFQRLQGTQKQTEILSHRPRISIDEFWPE